MSVSKKAAAERTKATYESSAQEYFDRFVQIHLYDECYDRFCSLIPPTSSLLEIGCGPGQVSMALLERLPDLRLTGIDYADSMVSLAKANVPSAEYRIMDCREISTLSERYDAVMAAFVMPYLDQIECKKLIEDVSQLLNDGGVFYFSTMQGPASKSGWEKTSFAGEQMVYINYHEEEYLRAFVEEVGFTVEDLTYVDYTEADGSITPDMIFICRKNGEV